MDCSKVSCPKKSCIIMDSPAVISSIWTEKGKEKVSISFSKTLILGIMAGMFIALGGHASMIISETIGEVITPGFSKFMGAAVFPVGIMLVVLAGGELFTGNNLIAISLFDKKITGWDVIKNLVIVYMANFIGAFLTALLLYQSGLYGGNLGEKILLVAEDKLSMSFSMAFIRGVFCNILVTLAVWIQAGAKDSCGKILALWFPVMLFVLSGFEHSIANMYFLPMGYFISGSIKLLEMLKLNLIPVTFGNIVGGSFIVSASYWYTYNKK